MHRYCTGSILLAAILLVGVCLPTGAAIQGEYFVWAGVSPPIDPWNPANRRGTRIDGNVNFDWGTGVPGIGGIGIDFFSVRWRGQVYLPNAGDWTFYTRTDDGARLYLNGELIINQWVDQGPTEYSATRSLGVGWHDIHMQYYENGGGAVAQLLFAGPGVGKQVIPAGSLRAEYGKGLLADYYNGNWGGAQTLVVSRNDDTINFDWGNGSPQPEVYADSFSVRWRGKVEAPASGNYTFYVTSDDGPAMWLNGTERFNNLGAGHAPTEYSSSATLTAGQKYFIEVQVNEFTGGAVCRLEWTGPGIGRQIVPEHRLHAILNEAPTDILLSNSAVGSNLPANTVVGALSTTDIDNTTGANPPQTHTYALVSGTGDTHNGLFNISGSNLRTTSANMTPGAYSVRVRTTDNGQTPNNLTFEKAFAITVNDTTPPTVTGVAVQSGQTVDVTFSEPMGAGVTTASNYVVSGSGKGSLGNSPASVALVSGNTYRLTWTTGVMFIGGDITITVSNAQDVAGNAVGSPNSGTHVGGGTATPPSPPVVSATSPTNNRRPTWSWDQGANPGSGNFRYDLNNSGVWTPTIALSFTPGSDLSEGTHRLVVQERDSGGNWSGDGYFDVEIDLTPPNPPVVGGPNLTNNTRPTWSWSTGGGGGSGNYRHDLNASGVWTNTSDADFTPTSDLPDGDHILAVQERDMVGNWSDSGVHTITIDTERPTALLEATVTVPDPTDMTPIPMRVVFSKPVTGFTDSDILVANASVDAFAAQSATEYTFNLLAADQAVITAQVPEDAALDAAGNGNEASAVFSRTFESARPTVTLSSTAPNPTNTAPIPVTVVFSVPVFGFSQAGILADNASILNFSGSGANYSFNLSPAGQGAVTAQVMEDAAVDGLGARNTTSNVLSRTYDTVSPTVVLSSGAPDPTNAAIPVTAEFDESVYGFTAGDVDATNADVTNFTGGDGDTVFTFTLTPTVSQGAISVQIPAAGAADAATNPNTASNVLSRDYDDVAPTVSSVVVVDALAVLVTFDKAMGAGADIPANYSVSGSGQGTLATHPAEVQPQSASVYRLLWNLPNEMVDGGDITITVGNVQDYLGNALGAPNSGTDAGGGIGEAPDAQCQDVAVYLSAPTIGVSDVDDGSSDNIAVETMTINGVAELTFSCADIAANPNEITLAVTDAAGNSAACVAQVTVVDDIPPVITIPGEQTRYLVAGMVFFPPLVTAMDNCDGDLPVDLMDDDGLAFAPTPVETGEYTLVYEARDDADNVTTEELTVIVADPEPIIISALGDRYFLLPVGASVTFAIEATGGVTTLGYQWKRLTSDKGLEVIPGADGFSYTIDPITLDDAGEYLCEVSDGFTAEHSDIFTLEIGTGVPVAGLFGLALAATLSAVAGIGVMGKRKR